MLAPGKDLDWAAPGGTWPSWWVPHRDAILRPPNPRSPHRRRVSSSPASTTSNSRPQTNHGPLPRGCSHTPTAVTVGLLVIMRAADLQVRCSRRWSYALSRLRSPSLACGSTAGFGDGLTYSSAQVSYCHSTHKSSREVHHQPWIESSVPRPAHRRPRSGISSARTRQGHSPLPPRPLHPRRRATRPNSRCHDCLPAWLRYCHSRRVGISLAPEVPGVSIHGV